MAILKIFLKGSVNLYSIFNFAKYKFYESNLSLVKNINCSLSSDNCSL